MGRHAQEDRGEKGRKEKENVRTVSKKRVRVTEGRSFCEFRLYLSPPSTIWDLKILTRRKAVRPNFDQL